MLPINDSTYPLGQISHTKSALSNEELTLRTCTLFVVYRCNGILEVGL